MIEEILEIVSSQLSLQFICLTATALLAFWGFLKATRAGKCRGGKGKPVPGPLGLPVIGNLFSLGKKPELTFVEMARICGNVFSVQMGSRRVVVLNGYEAVKEALVKNSTAFAGRPKFKAFDVIAKTQGIVFAPYNDIWKAHRKFMIKFFREFGLSSHQWENRVLEEVRYLLAEMKELEHKPTESDLFVTIGNAVSNVICSTCIGKRFDYGDKLYKKLLHCVHDQLEAAPIIAALDFIPLLWYVPWCNPTTQLKRDTDFVYDFCNNIIQEHKKVFDATRVKDFIDYYLLSMEEDEFINGGGELLFSDDFLTNTLVDLFAAGTENGTLVLNWCLLYMVRYPEIQKRVQQEIDQVVGRDRLPCLGDRPKLPFTLATVMETNRIATVAPLSIPRETTQDVELYGYSIPKGTCVFANLWSVHMDPKIWTNPTQFNPHRFINIGSGLKKPEEFIPFYLGRRSCPVEEAAFAEVFLIFTCILQAFTLNQPQGQPLPTLVGKPGITCRPHPFNVSLLSR